MTPTLLIWFNRPDLSRGQWDLIKDHLPGDVYIAIDGPRPDRPDDVPRVAECVSLAQTLVPPQRLLVRDRNLGCGLGVSGAITWFFDQVEEGIILEDDCYPHPRFFTFASELLERYRYDERVMGVSGDGTAVIDSSVFRGYSYDFARIPMIWGWASWRRAWKGYDYELKTWPEVKAKGHLFDVAPHEDAYNALYDMFDNVHRGVHSNTWDYQFVYHVFLQGGLFVIPNGNLVSNRGFGEGGTHTSGYSHRASAACYFSDDPLKHPLGIHSNLLLEESLYRSAWGVRRKSWLRRHLKKLLPNWSNRVTFSHWTRRQQAMIKKARSLQ